MQAKNKSTITTHSNFGKKVVFLNTPFKTLSPNEQEIWEKAYDAYVDRMIAEKMGLKIRTFKIWITDFGFTHK